MKTSAWKNTGVRAWTMAVLLLAGTSASAQRLMLETCYARTTSSDLPQIAFVKSYVYNPVAGIQLEDALKRYLGLPDTWHLEAVCHFVQGGPKEHAELEKAVVRSLRAGGYRVIFPRDPTD